MTTADKMKRNVEKTESSIECERTKTDNSCSRDYKE